MIIYSLNLASRMKVNIYNVLLENIALVFGGPKTAKVQYVAVLATYRVESALGHKSVCLALSPLEDKTTQGSSEHIHF